MMSLLVLSMVNLEEVIQNALTQEFKSVTFIFSTSMSEAKKKLPEADVIITYGEDIDEDHIVKAKKLKWIMVFTSGIDRLPKEMIKERNIIITNVKGIHKTPMAEYTILMMLQTARQNKIVIEDEKNKVWNKISYLTEIGEITGKTLLVIGAGQIGQEIARLAKAFQMKTYGLNRTGKQVAWFDQMFQNNQLWDFIRKADFIVSILPRTDETKHFWQKLHFKQMKNSAVFINIGRGETVKEEDLFSAMKDKEIKHAVLDVFEQEPLDPSHPFWEMENMTITPHIAGISNIYHQRAIQIFKANLRNVLNSSADWLNRVDLQKGY